MFLLSRKLPLDKNTKTNSKCFQRKITDYFNKAQILNINLHSPLHELLLWAEAVLFVHPPLDAAIDDLLDQLLPDSFAQDAADWIVGLGKGDDGVGIKEEKQKLVLGIVCIWYSEWQLSFAMVCSF